MRKLNSVLGSQDARATWNVHPHIDTSTVDTHGHNLDNHIKSKRFDFSLTATSDHVELHSHTLTHCFCCIGSHSLRFFAASKYPANSFKRTFQTIIELINFILKVWSYNRRFALNACMEYVDDAGHRARGTKNCHVLLQMSMLRNPSMCVYVCVGQT